jgi:hypothetical protein
MFPLSISNWIMIALGMMALGGISYGKYEAYKLDAYKVAQAKAVHDKEVQSQEDTDKIRKEKDAQIKAINSQLADALVSLRQRPSRSESTSNGQGRTGSALFAEDAEFLIREASRADQIRNALDACYKQYDVVAK